MNNTATIWVGTEKEYNLYAMNNDVQNSNLTFYIKDYGISYDWPEPTKPYLAVCECCGAPLKGTQCEYCGSTYIWK